MQCCIPTRVGIDEEEVERNASAKRKVNENLFEEYPSGQPVMEVKNLRKVFRSLTGIFLNDLYKCTKMEFVDNFAIKIDIYLIMFLLVYCIC